tara:strand:+ start:456 stop:662 length:207 start_codon:yes stop_codon:yes gene_type:complete
MGSIEKIYNELKQTKEQMNFHEQQIEQLNFRIEAIQRHHQIKMEQAMRIIKNLRKKKSDETRPQELIG